MAAEPWDGAQEPEDISGGPATRGATPDALPGDAADALPGTPSAEAPATDDGATVPPRPSTVPAPEQEKTSEDAPAIRQASTGPDYAADTAEREDAPGVPAGPAAAGHEAAPEPSAGGDSSMHASPGTGRQLWAEDWQELDPAELAGLIAGTDPDILDDWSAQEYLKAVRKLESWTHSRRTRALARMAALRPGDTGEPDGICRHAAQELAPVLAVPAKQAARDLADAHQIATYLPATLAALDAAEIDLPRATAIARKGIDLPPATLAEYEAKVLPGAGNITLESVHARARTTRDMLHPDPLETRHKAAMERRTVQYLPQDDAMAELYIRTSADKALLAYNLIQAHARKLQTAEETRTLGQLRADVFTDILLHYPDHVYQPATAAHNQSDVDAESDPKDTGTGQQGPCNGPNVTASVAVTAPLTTLLQLAEDPGELTGHGSIPPDMTRNAAALAKSWLLVLTDDYGHAIAAAKDLRKPPEWLKRLVRIRDRHCRDFGCTVPADQCEIDHTIAWEDGGKTVLENLGAFCKPGHKTKHHGGGSVTQGPDGTLHFTTRSGHTHTTTPDEGWAITYPVAADSDDSAGKDANEPPPEETPPPF